RLLSVPALVAELPRVVTDPGTLGTRRLQATPQLNRLAGAGIPGADPAAWPALREPSTPAELLPEPPATPAPTRIEALMNCRRRASLDRLDSEEETPVAMLRGTLVHAFAEAVARGADPERAGDMVTEAYMDLANVPSWSQETTEQDF